MGLYSYFIHETAIQEATDKFHDARYNKTNAEDFYQELCRLALRMVHPPDKYTFRMRLLSGLPSNIRRKIVDKGITAEVSTTGAIVKAARMAEDTIVILNRYEKYAHEHTTNHLVQLNRLNTTQGGNMRPQGASANQSSRDHPMRYCVVNRYTSSTPRATSSNPQN